MNTCKLAFLAALGTTLLAGSALADTTWTQDPKFASRWIDTSSVSVTPNQSPVLMAFRFSDNASGDPVFWSAIDCKTGQLYISDNEGGWKPQTYADGKPAMGDITDTLICH